MHLCNRCFQLFKTDIIFKKHQDEGNCFDLELPNMEITLQTCIPANILKLLIESNSIGVLKLRSTYPKNNNEEQSFENFQRDYRDQLYPDIEEISGSESEEESVVNNKKKMKKK